MNLVEHLLLIDNQLVVHGMANSGKHFHFFVVLSLQSFGLL